MPLDRLQTLYQARKALLVLALATPVVVLALVWFVVTQVLMAPAVPDADAPAHRVARFVMHDKGLPRMADDDARRLFHQIVGRLGRDPTYQQAFLAEIHTASPEMQRAFRRHLLSVFKPMLMGDIHDFEACAGDDRQPYLDARIIEYNRIARALGKTGINADAVGVLVPDKTELFEWLLQNTTEAERAAGMAYFTAIRQRVEEILADPALRDEFEQEIARGA